MRGSSSGFFYCIYFHFLLEFQNMNTNDTMQNTTTDAQIEAMAAVGAQFGFVKSRRHPSAESFIFGIKNKIEIFDLEKTGGALALAVDFVKTLGSKNGMILFVGGKTRPRRQ